MFCPKCGQEQISDDTRFCSRCGLLMTGVYEVVANQGMLPLASQTGEKKALSSRMRGLRHGGILFLSGGIIVPLLGVLSMMINFRREVVGMAAIICFLGGFLRMIYALAFESGDPKDKTLEENAYQAANQLLGKKPAMGALPPQQSIPVSNYAPPNWRDTNELAPPPSVTDGTTKLLENDK